MQAAARKGRSAGWGFTQCFSGSKISFKESVSSICGFSFHQPVTGVLRSHAFLHWPLPRIRFTQRRTSLTLPQLSF